MCHECNIFSNMTMVAMVTKKNSLVQFSPVLTLRENIPYIVACLLLVRFHLHLVQSSWDSVDIL